MGFLLQLLIMDFTEQLELISDKLIDIELIQPWTLGLDIDFSPLQDIQDQINVILNPDIYDDCDDDDCDDV